MNKPKIPLVSFRLKNFKAIRDSKTIKFTPLTVFIGNNGSGKSSIIEGLQTYQAILTKGLDEAMNGENIQNMAVRHSTKQVSEGHNYETNPIEFKIDYQIPRSRQYLKDERQSHFLSLTVSPNGGEVYIFEEEFSAQGKSNFTRDKDGLVTRSNDKTNSHPYQGGISVLKAWSNDFTEYQKAYDFVESWQFLQLNPVAMGQQVPQKRSADTVRLANDGSNIGEYLLDIRKQSLDAFEGIIEILQSVLPYASDLQTTLVSELETSVYLQLSEGQAKIPQWLLSTGTLRILALLALLRHPSPPPLIVIEEIENGFDPSTLHILIEEIKYVIEEGISQIIFTTHSPYLLDLLSLQHIVLVERMDGQPSFYRPADDATFENYSKEFGPGKLYTMGKLWREPSKRR